MTEYLFIGGPFDGEWHHADLRAPVAYEPERQWDITAEWAPVEPRYYRPRPLHVPGWRISLPVFVADPGVELEPGRLLPGWLVGHHGERSQICEDCHRRCWRIGGALDQCKRPAMHGRRR